MKKIVKITCSIICCLSFIASLTACGSKSSGGSANNNQSNEQKMKKHVVSLTKDNFYNYVEVTQTNTTFIFNGALSYALYENVTVSCIFNKGKTYEKTETLKLNAGGNASYVTGANYMDQTIELLTVSGTLTFWM